jgi:DNA-binding GntR family transcriptional regulator
MGDSLETASLANEAYGIVRERILRGELAIGKVISRRKIAAELGMSLLPVSEALLRLEFEGLLESRPRAGTRVKIPTEQDVRGHYVVREALEVEAARLFAEEATEQERAELMKLAVRVDTMSNQASSDRTLYLSLHERLHRRIAECTRCEALCEAIEKTHALDSTWLCVARPAPSNQPPRRAHQDLVEGLCKGNANTAAEAMRKHIASSMQNTLKRLEPYFQLQEASGNTFARSVKRQAKLVKSSKKPKKD